MKPAEKNHDCHCGHHHKQHEHDCGCGCGHFHGKGVGIVLLVRALCTAVCWILGALVFDGWVKIVLLSVALVVIGYDVLYGAVKGILKGKVFGETLLMTIAAVAAAIIGEWHEAIAVMLLYQIGEALQGFSTQKTKDRVLALVSLSADTALLFDGNKVTEVPAKSVAVGSLIEIRAGAKVPLDGVVQSGESTLDTSSLTGESLPVFVKEGDQVLSGSVNGDGKLIVRTTQAFEGGTAQKILAMVQSAANRKAKSQKFITAFARVYTPVVCLAAVLIAFLPMAFGQSLATWGRRALVFLVSSCPCALVISVPLAYFAGIGKAAACGVLVKGGTQLDALAKIRAIATDKTGTLTSGNLQVSAVTGQDPEVTLSLAAAVERHSNHPLARAIDQRAEAIDLPEVMDVTEKAGRGMTAMVGDKKLIVGSRTFLQESGVTAMDEEGTTVHVALDGKYVGAVVFCDEVKTEAKIALAQFKRQGVTRQVMLTGDGLVAAQNVARQVGIQEVYASLLPDQKVQRLSEVQRESGVTAFVGDGINDAPALTAADVGVAMGGLGSDAATMVADAVVSDDDLRRIPRAVAIARKTRTIVRQNVTVSIGVKLAVMVLGALGIAPMWLAVLADVGICIAAVCNCLRLILGKKRATE